ncbi:glycosyltransferase [Neobacillus drentensis]|uniref:glycosyltransferase family 2 protein n=1 Tax=Neobacillus drentensis TaxID=220684 RepID=UPI002FFEC74B
MAYPRIPDLVSVIIPTYNRAHFLEECLDSIIDQTYPHYEIIIVNNASTDNTLEVIEYWKEKRKDRLGSHRPVVTITLPRNVTYAGSITTALFLTRGEFIANQDSDDFSNAERFEKQVKLLKDHPDIDLVGTNWLAFNGETYEHVYLSDYLGFGDEIRERYLAGDHCVSHTTSMYRGRLFDQIGGFTRKMRNAEDYEFLYKSILKDNRLENLPEYLYYYRLHKDQMTNS